MSYITITSLTSPASNLTITDSLNNSTTITSNINDIVNVVTINQGSVGPPGPPGTGILNINNYGSNRLLVSDGSIDNIYATNNLTFDGSLLNVIGSGVFSNGLYVDSIPVSVSGHIHTTNSIIDFNSSVSGLLPVKNIIPGSGISVSNTSGNYTISSINNLTSNSYIFSDGRLTLQSGDPLYNNNISGSIIYYSPYLGNLISLYDISTLNWKIYYFNEISLTLSGMTINTNYDIFIYDNGGTLTLEKVAWANNTTRNNNIIYQNGILVKSGSLNKRYVGTIRATSSTNTEDSSSRRFLFNINNQIDKILNISDSTSHTYTNPTIRPYRNITTVGSTRVEFISGIHTTISIICDSYFATETSSSSVGISVDSNSLLNTLAKNTTTVSSGPALIFTNNSIDNINITTGYHYLQLVQSGSSITTFFNASLKAIIKC